MWVKTRAGGITTMTGKMTPRMNLVQSDPIIQNDSLPTLGIILTTKDMAV